MTAMKKTLLQIVQDILSDTDAEPANTLSDTLEAEQLATIIEHVFYDIIATRSTPEHNELIKLTAASDSAYPVHFSIPDNVNSIVNFWYDVTKASTGTGDYRELHWLDPVEFLQRADGLSDTDTTTSTFLDKNGGTKVKVQNNKSPEYYTSFDDHWVVCDSYNSAYDTTLQESKCRVLGNRYPVFDRFTESYVPDIDANFFPYLISESRSRYLDWLQGGTTRKAEEAARRAKVHLRNDKYNILRGNVRNQYGR